MRFTKYAAVIAAAGALVLAGCSGGTTAPEETDAPVAEDVSFEAGTTMAKLHDAGKITVGTKFDQPLFGLKGLDGNPEGIKSVDDIAGKKVCSVTGSTSAQNLKDRGVDVLETDTYSNCLTPLRQGEVVAVSTDNVILAGLADQNQGEFEVVDNPFTEEPYGIGLKKDDDAFRAFINDTLEAAFADGRWASAWEKTAGKVLSTPTPPTIDRY